MSSVADFITLHLHVYNNSLILWHSSWVVETDIEIRNNTDQNNLSISFIGEFYIHFNSHLTTNSIGNHFGLLIWGSLDWYKAMRAIPHKMLKWMKLMLKVCINSNQKKLPISLERAFLFILIVICVSKIVHITLGY